MELQNNARIFLSLCIALCVFTASGSESNDNGLGERINWVSLEKGYEIAQNENKPLMLIIHKSWCGACRSLKPKIAESEEIFNLSENFVMVNTMDDDEPKAGNDKYTPDGGYIPRILFFGPKGELLRDEINKGGNDKYKYYYYDEESVAESMKRVYKSISSPESEESLEKDLDKASEETQSSSSTDENRSEL